MAGLIPALAPGSKRRSTARRSRLDVLDVSYVPVRTYKSFCRFCHAVCGIEVDVEANRALDVRGDKDHPISQGYLCVKGRALIEQHEHPDRLRAARKRLADGTWRDIGSQRAMDEVADRLQRLIARDGPSAIAVYSGTHGLFSAGKPLI